MDYLFVNGFRRYQYSVSQCADDTFGVFVTGIHPATVPRLSSEIPTFNTEAEAQNALDGYAKKQGLEPMVDIGGEEQPVTCNDVDAVSEPPQDTGEPEHEEPEQPEQQPEDLDEPKQPSEPVPEVTDGERVSLRDEVFNEAITACDSKINSALRIAIESDQSKFDFIAKITFQRQGNGFSINHETGYKFDPINYKSKAPLRENISIVLDANGNPIIPYDREHQTTLEEAVENEVTTTVDGNTGLVECMDTGEPRPEDTEEEDT